MPLHHLNMRPGYPDEGDLGDSLLRLWGYDQPDELWLQMNPRRNPGEPGGSATLPGNQGGSNNPTGSPHDPDNNPPHNPGEPGGSATLPGNQETRAAATTMVMMAAILPSPSSLSGRRWARTRGRRRRRIPFRRAPTQKTCPMVNTTTATAITSLSPPAATATPPCGPAGATTTRPISSVLTEPLAALTTAPTPIRLPARSIPSNPRTRPRRRSAIRMTSVTR